MSYSPFITRLSTLIIAIGLILSSNITHAKSKQPEQQSNEAINLAQTVYDRPAGTDASSKVIMLLEKKGQSPKERVLYTFAKDNGNNQQLTLMRFVEPSEVEGTGLLTIDYSGDDSDQWLYLPALKKVRRISSKRKGGRFVGSDFYYEDLMDREVDMDHHNIVGTDKVGGAPCTLLESIPVDKSNSVYSKRVSCIYTKLMIPLRIDFYDGKETPIKRLQAKKIKKIQGYWTIFDSTMYDFKTGHSTKLLTTDIVYDQGIPDDLFGLRGLSDDSREVPYRPEETQGKKE